jgi:uncharacterized protein (TIGR03086 family)
MTLDLSAPAAELTRIVSGVRDDQLTAPTPNSGRDVATLLAHVHGLAIAFRDAAYKIEGPTTSTAPDDDRSELPEGWRTEIPARLAELAEAWKAPEAWEGMSKAGGITMPGAITGLVANNELVLHGWDLAKATGQPYAVEPENLQASWQMVYDTPDAPAAEREGLFGPRLPIAEDAPMLDRTLAYAGRDPNWSPLPS